MIRAVKCVALLWALLLATPEARANTYLFSFTVAQVEAALKAAHGTSAYNDSAYYAIFVQPSPAQISGYTYVSETSPNPQEVNAWDATTITDPTSPYLGYSPGSPCTSNCTWAEFTKDPNAPTVAVLSGANGGTAGANIFYQEYWSDNVAPPYGWGGNGSNWQEITEIMPVTDVFFFSISTTQALTGSYTLLGSASALESGSPSTFTLDAKDDGGLTFTLTATIVPEPPAWAPLATGLLLMAPFIYQKVRKRQPPVCDRGPDSQ